jgi:cysteinyl-tRNA synthetase
VKYKLNLYNTATCSKEAFTPLHSETGMYCCGPTVYNYAHIGNLRTYIFEDVLKRLMRFLGYNVKHVMNITDVGHLTSDADTGEDKMEKGALREGKSVWDIAAYYTDVFFRNCADLNIAKPDVCPKATDHIPAMIAMVGELERKGFTYRTGDGIYFDTSKFPAYADFAHLDVDSLQAGSRVAMGEKKHATDFALWKFSPTNVQRQMEWDSPWGTGFPGWHIECSAMSLAYLPQPIDIHCGGMDHIRVHHTNEIAQAEAATGLPFVRNWLHGEFLVLDKGKMAKSGGSFITLDTVKKEGISPLAYRMFCYSAHYRSPLMFSWDGLKSSAQGLVNLKKHSTVETKKPASGVVVSQEKVDLALAPVIEALCDDCNVPMAMAALWTLVRDKNFTAEERYCAVEAVDSILALDLLVPDAVKEITAEYGIVRFVGASALDAAAVERIVVLVGERKNARLTKNYARADEIRKELQQTGIEVKDLPGGIAECSCGA